jgi:hypothetical protein
VSKINAEEKRKELLERLGKAERTERESKAESAEESRKQAHARAWELAKRQGVKPISSMNELKGDFWPEEESVDEFLAWVRELRQSDKPRDF